MRHNPISISGQPERMTTHVTAPNDSNTRRKSPDPVSGGRSRWGGHNVCNMGRKERGKGEQQSEREVAARSQQGGGAICGVMVRVATESPQHHHCHTTAKYSILATWIDQNM